MVVTLAGATIVGLIPEVRDFLTLVLIWLLIAGSLPAIAIAFCELVKSWIP